jgi:peptide/nickel transport system permease protein
VAPTLRYAGRRFVLMLATLFALTTLVFLMLQLIPGDTARVVAGEYATPEQVEVVRDRLSLDDGLVQQYVTYLSRVSHGDLGTSTVTFRPVASDVANVLPDTLELVLLATLLNVIVAVPLGIVAATRAGRGSDKLTRILAVIAAGFPVFWLALILQFLLGSRLKWFPLSGQNSFGDAAPDRTGAPTLDALLSLDFGSFADALWYLVLPVVVLSVHFAAQLFRTQRVALLGELQKDYVMVVRAKGVSERRLIWRHALPNAAGPVVSTIALQLGGMIGMAVLVEAVFVRQGVGSYLTTSVAEKDTYAVLGAVLFVGAIICVANFIADLIQLYVDPRVRQFELRGTAT